MGVVLQEVFDINTQIKLQLENVTSETEIELIKISVPVNGIDRALDVFDIVTE